MGFDQAGYDCLFQVEWDKHCQQILARHWPDVPRWSDVQDVNGAELPPCDVLTFGSPCQDLSVAGKRAGIDGGRSSMFFEATRIIREMRDATGNTYPRIVVWENVPGALSSNRGADFQAVIDEMADCGALLTEWAVLDAQHFGVPQRRRRIFLVAVLDPATASRCPDPLLPVAPGSRGDYQKGNPTGQDIAGTLGASVRGSQSTAVKAKRAMSNTDFDRWKETDLCPTLNAFDNAGESRSTVLVFCPARRLTPVECERLMGWPDNHTRWKPDGTEQADSHRYKQCGNGVATPVARWVAQQIMQVLGG